MNLLWQGFFFLFLVGNQEVMPTYYPTLYGVCPRFFHKLKNWMMQQEWAMFRKQKLLVYISRPQNRFRALPQPQKKPIRAHKAKNHPKIRSKSKVIIHGNIENKRYSTIWVDHKIVLKLYPNPKDSILGHLGQKRPID